MTWTIMKTGEYAGRTLPQVLFIDPDWFFYCMEKHGFSGNLFLMREAQDIDKKARSIRIPQDGDFVVEYDIMPVTGGFCGMGIVPRTNDWNVGATKSLRRDTINMSIPHFIKPNHKDSNRMFISQLKKILFGSSRVPMTKKRCEEFFDDPKNFK
jgi:hypothetical protein